MCVNSTSRSRDRLVALMKKHRRPVPMKEATCTVKRTRRRPANPDHSHPTKGFNRSPSISSSLYWALLSSSASYGVRDQGHCAIRPYGRYYRCPLDMPATMIGLLLDWSDL